MPLKVDESRAGRRSGSRQRREPHNSAVEADVALSRCAPSGPRSLTPGVRPTRVPTWLSVAKRERSSPGSSRSEPFVVFRGWAGCVSRCLVGRAGRRLSRSRSAASWRTRGRPDTATAILTPFGSTPGHSYTAAGVDRSAPNTASAILTLSDRDPGAPASLPCWLRPRQRTLLLPEADVDDPAAIVAPFGSRPGRPRSAALLAAPKAADVVPPKADLDDQGRPWRRPRS